MMPSLYSGVASLKNHQTRMNVIGNNIANINTIGFKSSRTTFADMLSMTQKGAASANTSAGVGGTNPVQIGLGMSVASVDMLFTDGSPQSTGKNTDIALSGSGLFVLKSGGNTYYSRDGSFEFDTNGDYVLPGSGYKVQGWNAASDGTLNTTGSATDVNVKTGKTMPGTQTTQVTYSGNLNATTPIITNIVTTSPPSGNAANVTTYDSAGKPSSVNIDGTNVLAATLTLSDGTTQTVSSGYYEVGYSIPVTTEYTIYDSKGTAHVVTLMLDKFGPSSSEVATTTTVTQYYSNNTGEYVYSYTESGTDKFALVDPNTTPPNVVSTYTTLAAATAATGVGTTTKIAPSNLTGGYTLQTTSATVNTTTTVTSTDNVNSWRVYTPVPSGTLGPAAGSDTYEPTSIVQEDDGTEMVIKLGEGATDNALGGQLPIIKFNNTGEIDATGDTPSLTMTYTNGADEMNIYASFASGVTQYAGSSTIYGTADGNAYGILQSIQIDTSGIITGTYSNGELRTEAQIAVAQFVNSAGLTKVGTSLYQESNNSGVPNIKTVSDLGLSITPSALEMSNVDLAAELADLIVTQRGFQAGSKTITVSDEMLETLIGLKR